MAIEHEIPVLVVGAGPAGMIAALQLAQHKTPCMLVERNLETTRWPKMNITNCRSMEIFRRLGISEGLREVGVPQHYSFDSQFSTGLSQGGEILTTWAYPSPDKWRKTIQETNDGTQPREPYQRCTQAVFEAWLRPILKKTPLVESFFGFKFESLEEKADRVISRFTDVSTGEEHAVTSQYIIGADGAGSRVRKSIGGSLIGGPLPGAFFLIHFRSSDVTRLQKTGQFWHIFFADGGALISQNEKDIWTVHTPISPDIDYKTLDPEKTIAEVLGAATAIPYPIKVDAILVTSIWRPNICIAEKYRSASGRVFLAGDSAHQNIPTGGYGYNTAIGDSTGLGWKLAAVFQGYGGPHLLDSYEPERRPIGARNIEYSGLHSGTHRKYAEWVLEAGREVAVLQTEEGRKLRKRIIEHLETNDMENRCFGIELDYRYNHSPVIVPDLETQEPEWDFEHYVPHTWPGARAPHVFLADGKTSIFDLFGPDFTLVDFSEHGSFGKQFATKAEELGVPLKVIHLPTESHVRSIWARDAVLIRPDDHVAWRATSDGRLPEDTEGILSIAVGRKSATSTAEVNDFQEKQTAFIEKRGFTSTVGNVDQTKIKGLAAWQEVV